MSKPSAHKFAKSKMETFTIEAEDGELSHYCVKCFSGKHRAAYMQEVQASSKEVKHENGESTFEFADGYKDIPLLLLQRCVREYDNQTERSGKLVEVEVLEEWDSSILDGLADIANRVCKLNMDDDSTAKND